MMDNKWFWVAQNLFLLAVYACGAAMLIDGKTDSVMVWISAIILIAHVLEIPIAMQVLKAKNPAPGRLVLGTLLFGFTWWLPAKKGIYEVF